MSELKTKANDASVEEFIDSVADEGRRGDARAVLAMFERASGEKGRMWGTAIIGFGERVLTYPNGRTLDWMVTGFSPRKANTTLYTLCDSPDQPALLEKLGRHTTGKGCIYIKKLSDIDEKILAAVIKDAYKFLKKTTAVGKNK